MARIWGSVSGLAGVPSALAAAGRPFQSGRLSTRTAVMPTWMRATMR